MGRGGADAAGSQGTGCPVPRPPTGFPDQLPNQAGPGLFTVLVPEFVITTSTKSYMDLMGKSTFQSGVLWEDSVLSTLLTG